MTDHAELIERLRAILPSLGHGIIYQSHWGEELDAVDALETERVFAKAFTVCTELDTALAALVAERDALRAEVARMREHLGKAVLSEEIVITMASFTDPRNVSSPDEELELFASLIEDAKKIHGDLYEGEDAALAQGGEK